MGTKWEPNILLTCRQAHYWGRCKKNVRPRNVWPVKCFDTNAIYGWTFQNVIFVAGPCTVRCLLSNQFGNSHKSVVCRSLIFLFLGCRLQTLVRLLKLSGLKLSKRLSHSHVKHGMKEVGFSLAGARRDGHKSRAQR